MPPTRASRTLGGVQILLVEDEDDTRDTLTDVLVLHGTVVTAAASGNAGFAAFRRARPDLLLSDLWMEDGNGFELIERIRALDPDDGGLTPAIALSAVESSKSAMLAGYHAFMAKPFDIGRLLALVEDFARIEGTPRLVAPWTLYAPAPGRIVVKLQDDVRARDMLDLMNALVVHLEAGPVEVTVDLRGLVSFAPSVGSVGERALWSRRKAIRSLRVVGGSWLARLVSASACRVLGIPCEAAADLR